MTLRILAVFAVLAFGLGGCADLGLPEEGFVTHAFDTDDGTPVPSANSCTAESCPQAAGFCTARGYAPGTAGYDRCLASVEENLRKESR